MKKWGMIVLLMVIVSIGPVQARGEAGHPVISASNAPQVMGLYDVGAEAWRLDGLAWSPDGSRIVTGGYDGALRLWNPVGGSLLRELVGGSNAGILSGVPRPEGNYGDIRQVIWTPGSPLLAVAHSSIGQAMLWDVDQVKVQQVLDPQLGEKEVMMSMAWSPSATRLMIGTSTGALHMFDATTGTRLYQIQAHSWYVVAAAFSPDSMRLVTAGFDQAIKVWNTDDGALLAQWTLPDTWATSVAWSPDGSTIAAGLASGDTLLWEAGSGLLLNTLHGHVFQSGADRNGVSCLAFSPDGTLLATGGGVDGAVRLWNMGDPVGIVQSLGGQNGGIATLSWAPDGRFLASGDEHGGLRVWGVPALEAGWQARVHVTQEDKLNVRRDPEVADNILERLDDAALVTLLEGPLDAGGYPWWRVRTEAGTEGWVVASADNVNTLNPLTVETTYPPLATEAPESFVYPTPTLDAPQIPTITPGTTLTPGP
jgi:WD40 repeat protein